MCTLELSKVLMYQPHNGYIKIKYGNNSRLLFTDTYSLLYEIKNEDLSMKNAYGDLESHNKYKDVLLNKNLLRPSMNRILKQELIKSIRFPCLAWIHPKQWM